MIEWYAWISLNPYLKIFLIGTCPKCNNIIFGRWHITGKSECSSLCGQGYKSLDIHCMKYSIHKGQTVPVDDHYCGDQLKPPTREPCHGDCVLTRWHYSEWSQVWMRSMASSKLLLFFLLIKYWSLYSLVLLKLFFILSPFVTTLLFSISVPGVVEEGRSLENPTVWITLDVVLLTENAKDFPEWR